MFTHYPCDESLPPEHTLILILWNDKAGVLILRNTKLRPEQALQSHKRASKNLPVPPHGLTASAYLF